MPDREDLAVILREGAEAVCSSFEDPDDDWEMQMVAVDDTDALCFVALDPRFLKNEKRKDMLGFEVMPAIVKQLQAQAVATLSSAWQVKASHPEEWAKFEKWRKENPNASLSEYPEHEEVVQVLAVDLDGPETWTACITRDGENPPTLGEWEQLSDANMSGRFVGPITAALKDVAEGK